MGLIVKEKDFPRGDKKPAEFNKRKSLTSKPLRKSVHKHKEKAEKDEGNDNHTIEGEIVDLKPKFASRLTYKNLMEGMLILGCVKKIKPSAIVVALPGHIFGHVPLTQVSELYSRALSTGKNSSHLEDMFSVGQHVVVKVIEHSENGVTLTMAPNLIHSHWTRSMIGVGSVVVAAVRSVEDHVYVMDLGIAGVRAFLKKTMTNKYEKIWNKGQPLVVGQVIRCMVQKLDSASSTTTVELSAEPKNVSAAEADFDSYGIDAVLPGSSCKVLIKKILPEGLRVELPNKSVGYIYQDHLSHPWHTPSDYKTDTECYARLLYVVPIVKLPYLCLRTEICSSKLMKKSPYDIINIGDIIKNATVLHASNMGIVLKLGNPSEPLRAYVSLRRSLGLNKLDSPTAVKDMLTSKYAIGSKHKCRVLDFDYMDQTYICTMEKFLLNAKYAHPSHLKPGELVSCVIERIESKEAVVNILDNDRRSFTAFICLYHLSDVVLSRPEKKFIPGSEWKGRVLSVNDTKIHLTLKPSLVNSKLPPLTSYEDVKPKVPYEGTVVHMSPQGLVITFYSDVHGFLPRRYMGEASVGEIQNFYHIGQTVKCYVALLNVETEEFILSLTPNVEKAQKFKREVNVGKSYKVTVKDITSKGLHIDCNALPGIIPTLHLSDNQKLAESLLTTFSKEDCIEAYCFNDRNPLQPIFTIRQSLVSFFQDENNKSLLENGVTSLQLGQCLPCSVHSVSPQGITVNVPLPDINGPVFIPLKDVVDFEVSSGEELGIVQHQCLYAKVLRIHGKKLFLCTKLSRVLKCSVEHGSSLLNNYLDERQTILTNLQKKGVPWSNVKPGTTVTGMVTELSESEATIQLDNDVIGKIQTPHFSKDKLIQGQKVTGTVLDVNLSDGYLDITVDPQVMKIVSPVQDGCVESDLAVGSYIRADILLVKSDYILVTLRGRGRFQLAYAVIRSHVNHLYPDTHQYKVKDTHKVLLHSMENGRIITLFKKNMKEVEREEKRLRRFLQKKNNKSKTGINESDIKQEVPSDDEDTMRQPDINREEVSFDVKVEEIKTEPESEAEICEDKNNTVDDKTQNKENASDDRISKLKKKERKRQNSVNDNVLLLTSDERTDNVRTKNKDSATDSINKKDRKRQNSGSLRENSSLLKSSDEIDIKVIESSDLKSKLEEEEPVSITQESVQNKKCKKRKTLDNKTELEVQKKLKVVSDVNKEDNEVKVEECFSVSESNEDISVIESNIKYKNKNVETSDMLNRRKRKTKDGENIVQEYNDCEDTLPRLPVKAGFIWDPKPEHLRSVLGKENVESSSEEDDETEQNEPTEKKKKKRMTMSEKLELERKEEQRIREIELRLTDENRAPQTADDFDRLLLSSPNNSVYWIQYIAFHLQATEIEKARSVARRALKTISFREEAEKLNVWIAFLNLEVLYGTKESLESVLREAVQYCDPVKVYLKMFVIYSDSQKKEEADRLIMFATKKYKDNLDIWTEGALAYMKLDMVDKARGLLQKSLQSLDKKLHVTIICKFALLEQKFGSPERAQTLFEQVLTSYPKRVDVWCTYVDMLIKADQLDLARQVLERSVVQKLPTHKMKTLFKKFLSFEETHGTPDGAARVREMAVNYTQAACDTSFV